MRGCAPRARGRGDPCTRYSDTIIIVDPVASLKHVVIVGGGFGGIAAARALRRAPVRLTMIDRRNHHLFQPLLYQVATAALNPSDIASPIRRILRRQRNASVILGEASSIDTRRKIVQLLDGEVAYDYLIVATGATHSYFGHDEWLEPAPGLKTLEDAVEIRRRVLVAYEAAEREVDAAEVCELDDVRDNRRRADGGRDGGGARGDFAARARARFSTNRSGQRAHHPDRGGAEGAAGDVARVVGECAAATGAAGCRGDYGLAGDGDR